MGSVALTAGVLHTAAVHHDLGGGEIALFIVASVLCLIGCLLLLLARKAVHAALGMALVMVTLGVVYLAQGAPFLGVVQIFVYTGAVMMLFLFVLMLVGVSSHDSLVETIKGQRVLSVLFALGLTGLLVSVVVDVKGSRAVGLDAVNADGNITAVAGRIFGPYVWAFEITSALLITAALGAMMLAHRERLTPKLTQRELSMRRIKDGAVKAPLPAPGVFARHNAVDVPALLPDGTPSLLSVSRVLRARGQERSAVQEARAVTVIEAEIRDPLALHRGDEAPTSDTEGDPQ